MNKGKVTKAIMIGVFVPAIAIGVYYGGKWAIKQYNKSKGGKGGDETKDDSLLEVVKTSISKPKSPFKTEAEIIAFQKYAKANGADLGNYGVNKDGIDGQWGSKTQAAYEKYGAKYTKDKLNQGDTSVLESVATTIHDAKGGAWYKNDNEEAVYSSLKSIGTKANWERLIHIFQSKYNTGIWNYLETFMNSAEMYTINNIIKKYK